MDSEEFGCPECAVPEGSDVTQEEVCMRRRISGICPQIPIIQRLQLQLEWLAERTDPYEALGCDTIHSTEDIIKASEEAVKGEENG